MEAYHSIQQFDAMALPETMLDKTVNNDDSLIQGLSQEFLVVIIQAISKRGSMYIFREGLHIKRRKDLESLPETVTEITVMRKRIIFAAIYRSTN